MTRPLAVSSRMMPQTQAAVRSCTVPGSGPDSHTMFPSGRRRPSTARNGLTTPEAVALQGYHQADLRSDEDTGPRVVHGRQQVEVLVGVSSPSGYLRRLADDHHTSASLTSRNGRLL